MSLHPGAWATTITGFGNAAVLLLLSALIALWLLSTSGRRACLLWCGAVLICSGTTALLKTYFAVCPLTALHLHSPSGHASFSTLVYGGGALSLAAGGRQAWQRGLIVSAGLAFALVIGGSRLAVRAHSGPEVLLGFLIGGATLIAYARLSARLPQRRFPPLLAGALLLLMLLAAQSRGFTLEQLFQHWGHWLRLRAPICVAS